jgi:hypothetical protein
MVCRFAKVALQRLMEVVQKGDEMYHGVVLDILKAIFEVIVPPCPVLSCLHNWPCNTTILPSVVGARLSSEGHRSDHDDDDFLGSTLIACNHGFLGTRGEFHKKGGKIGEKF